MVKLRPLDSPALIDLAAGWLAQKENYQWLNFGGGRQIVTPALLKVMAQRDSHCMRVYTHGNDGDDDAPPIGIVALNDVDRVAGTATLWVVAGDKSFNRRGYAIYATYKLLGLAFDELGLQAVNTWVADGNPSRRLIQRAGFHYIGRQRRCHRMGEFLVDRLFYDLLAEEYREHEPLLMQNAPVDV